MTVDPTPQSSCDQGTVASLALGVAHDFKNLLFIITAHCHRVLQATAVDDPRHASVEAIKTASDRALALTAHLLEAGRGAEPPVRHVDLNAIVGGLEGLLRCIVGPHVRLVLDLQKDPWPLRMNQTQIEQVIMNLATNARDAMPDGGTLVLATGNERLVAGDGRSRDAVVLTARDTGRGMTPDVQARLFEPYFTTKGGRGTGIGLATVNAIVLANGGHIDVASEPGAGTTFRVRLPRAVQAASPAARPLPQSALQRRVLLVEDEPAIRALLAQCLEAEGYDLVLAGSGAEALSLCMETEHAIDLVVADLNLPDVLGSEVASRLRSRTPDLPVVFMSGSLDTATQVAEVTRIPVLTKPFSLAEFNRAVRGALGTRTAA